MSAAPEYHGRGAALYRERAWKCLQLARQARDRGYIPAARVTSTRHANSVPLHTIWAARLPRA